MKRILTLVVVALSILVSSTAFAKPTRAPIKLDTTKLEKAKVTKAKPRLKLKPGAVDKALKRIKATKATKATKARPKIRLKNVRIR
jgi:hypothetical protein